IEVLAEPAPQRRGNLNRGAAVPPGVRLEHVDVRAQAVLADLAPAAVAAWDVLLERHVVALFQAPTILGDLADLNDAAHVLVAHDGTGAIAQRSRVRPHVAAA